MKSLRVIVEFSDCVIQALDLHTFSILIDDNSKRAKNTEV